jgi:two-component system phosphate regulon response regulator OmpR
MGAWTYVPTADEFRDDAGGVLPLSTAELQLIKELAMKAGQPVSRDELCARLGSDPDTRNIDVQVTRLRRKIEQDTKNPKFLQTIRGKGYVLRAEGV